MQEGLCGRVDFGGSHLGDVRIGPRAFQAFAQMTFEFFEHTAKPRVLSRSDSQ